MSLGAITSPSAYSYSAASSGADDCGASPDQDFVFVVPGGDGEPGPEAPPPAVTECLAGRSDVALFPSVPTDSSNLLILAEVAMDAKKSGVCGGGGGFLCVVCGFSWFHFSQSHLGGGGAIIFGGQVIKLGMIAACARLCRTCATALPSGARVLFTCFFVRARMRCMCVYAYPKETLRV